MSFSHSHITQKADDWAVGKIARDLELVMT